MKYEKNLTINEPKTGIVFEIERYAVNDGPGIRTVVFFKGCPLRCIWCANPESQSKEPQLVWWGNKCLRCGKCVSICPEKALALNAEGMEIDHKKCSLCGKCTHACNADAMVIIGRKMTPQEVLDELLKDEIFYNTSNGGVTFSGGESLMQHEFLLETAKLCKQHEISTCIETCGYAKWEYIEAVAPYIDLFLYDFKMMNDEKHKEFTGVSNKIILENFIKLVNMRKPVVVRIPVIPGLNDSGENYAELVRFLKQYVPGNKVDLLPYHRLGVSKYNRMKTEYELKDLLPPSSIRMQELKEFFSNEGFDVSIGG